MKAITDTLEVARSHQYEKINVRTHYTRPDDEKYLALIKTITDNRPTYGYRRTTGAREPCSGGRGKAADQP